MRRNYILLLFIFLVGIFLRFYKFDAFVTFLGDQARDVVVMKRIITFEHFPAIGPVSSVGNVYLGPFYYYLMTPWLWLFRLNPIGPAIGVAIFSSLYILINYFIVKKIFSETVAFLSSVLLAFSYTLINFSRFSWNPNLLPLFVLLTIYFFIGENFILAGAFLSLSMQLHYLTLFLVPAIIVFALRKGIKKYAVGFLKSFLSFLVFSSPLIIFDLRHQFLNAKNFAMLFKNSSNIVGDKFSNFINTGYFLNQFSFGIVTSIASPIVFIGVIFLVVLLIFKTKRKISDFFIFFLVTILGISLYGGPKYPHYFAIIYPLYYVVIAYILTIFPKNFWGYLLITLFMLSFITSNWQYYYFLKKNGSHQIERAKKISKVIYNNIGTKSYTLSALPEVYSDHIARYFLEIWDRKPIEREDKTPTNELFIICEQRCDPMNTPIWDIAYFNPTKIIGQWKTEDVTIYKLIR